MSAQLGLATLAAIALVALTGCWDSQADKTTPSAATCKPEYYRTLPTGKYRDSLVQNCMTHGQYQAPDPQTF
jgi:entry exclusion lipoprotein TrbK